MPPYVVAVVLVLVLPTSLGSAFLQVGPRPTSHRQLAERSGSGGTNTSPTGGYLSNLSSPSSVVVDTQKKLDGEKFQRALLEAKLAYDANAAASTTAATAAVEVVEEVSADVDVAPSPSPAPAVINAESVPEPAVEDVSTGIPEPEIQTIINKGSSEKGVKQTTEFTIPRELAIVPINESTVQFTAGALGGAVGFIVGGPILGIMTASVFNYLSRKEDDTKSSSAATTSSAKKIVDTASQTALLAYNYVAQFEKKNKIVDSIFKLLERMTDRAKETDSPASEVLVSLEKTLGGIANKVEELNDDYDIVGGVGTVLDSVGDLVEISVDKVVELNEEYKFTDRAVDAVKVVVGKVAEKK